MKRKTAGLMNFKWLRAIQFGEFGIDGLNQVTLLFKRCLLRNRLYYDLRRVHKDMESSPISPVWNRRGRAEIVALIIASAKTWQSAFRIMEGAHLNSQQAKQYLEELSRLGLIDASRQSGKETYKASKKGIQYLRQYDLLKKLLKA